MKQLFKIRKTIKDHGQEFGAITILLVFLIGIFILPVQIPSNYDFVVMYNYDRGLLAGIPIYDHEAQLEFALSNLSTETGLSYSAPFPYPPWYALVTLPLGLIPVQLSARIWFAVNLVLLFTALWLLTSGWLIKKKFIFFILSLLFLPVLEILVIGQFDFPVLLGAALIIYSVNREKPLVTAIALALLTFKPHLGVLLILAVVIYLLCLKNAFGRSALKFSILIGIFLFAIGFLADPMWPKNYLNTLFSFNQISEVASCDICVSFPVILARLLKGYSSSDLAFLLGFLIFVFLTLGCILTQKQQLRSIDYLVSLFAMITIFSSPYLFLYDYVLLLVPILLVGRSYLNIKDWIFVITIIIIPMIGFILWRREGNFAIYLSTLILFFYFLFKTKLSITSQD